MVGEWGWVQDVTLRARSQLLRCNVSLRVQEGFLFFCPLTKTQSVLVPQSDSTDLKRNSTKRSNAVSPPSSLLCGYYSVRQSIVIASRRDLAIIAAGSIFCLRGESLNVTFITIAIMNQNGEIKVEAAFLDSL